MVGVLAEDGRGRDVGGSLIALEGTVRALLGDHMTSGVFLCTDGGDRVRGNFVGGARGMIWKRTVLTRCKVLFMWGLRFPGWGDRTVTVPSSSISEQGGTSG